MAEGKSRGVTFAERQLLCRGWEHGKGLGRAEDGISEAIKVKVKCDKAGVGHKEGDQFTFHWWDHVFNKASSSLQVETGENGVRVKKNLDAGDGGTISHKKPLKASHAKEKLYGCFVKSATLLSGQEQPEPKSPSAHASSAEDDDDEEEELKLDLSSTTGLSDAELVMACGGRTAHKGARYGLTMSAKLARLEQQEAEFMAKYGKKTQPPSPPPGPAALGEETGEGAARKRAKRRKLEGPRAEDGGGDRTPRERKKKSKRADGALAAAPEEGELCGAAADKRQKTKAGAEQIKGRTLASEDRQTEKRGSRRPLQAEPAQDGVGHKKKKKKKKDAPLNEN